MNKFWFAILFGLSSALLLACGGGDDSAATGGDTTGDPCATRESSDAASAYQKACKEFQEVTVPAARQEGVVNWYTCTGIEQGQEIVDKFEARYPGIKVNYTNMSTAEALEKISAEAQAGRALGDLWQCGGQSGRNLFWRDLAMGYTPPTVLDPDIEKNWDAMQVLENEPACNGEACFGIASVGLAGLLVNTRFVPEANYPKTWKDLTDDPYWTKLIKDGLVAFADPRRPGHGNYFITGYRDDHKGEYGETFIRNLAALKPKFVATIGNEVVRGEYYAAVWTGIQTSWLKDGAPVKLLCPDPGCNVVWLYPEITKAAPHPNAAKVFVDFYYSQEVQQIFADYGNVPWRKDVKIKFPDLDYKNHSLIIWPDDATEERNRVTLEWLNQTKVFD